MASSPQNLFQIPFLKPFELPEAPLVYHLGVRRGAAMGKPISIGHQILLAQRVIGEAVNANAIGLEDRVMIFGAGAAGIAAAISAAERGIQVTVREQNPHPFAPQAASQTRWVHPYQYDWPAAHWREDRFPRQGAAPLTWSAGLAHEIARNWSTQLEEAQARFSSLLTIKYEHKATQLPRRDPQWDKLPEEEARALYQERFKTFLAAEDPDEEDQASLYLICTGFGNECCSIPTFRGYPFWSTDKLSEPNYGVENEIDSILVSGGADGAQQDLLRLAFAKPPGLLLAEMEVSITASANGENWWRELSNQILQREEQAMQNGDLADLAAFYTRAIDEMPPEIWDKAQQVIQRELRPEFVRQGITFLFKRTSFPRCFPLNRLLVLLLRRYMLAAHRHDIFLPETELGDQASAIAPHTCGNSPAACHGHNHEVELQSNSGTTKRSFGLIVIRHGKPKRMP